MNDLKIEFLNKSRSYTACISASHKMLFNNILVIFRHTWLHVLLLAMAIALLFTFYIEALTDGRGTYQLYLCLMSSLVLTVFFQIGYLSRIFMLLDHQPMKWNVKRCFRLFLLYLCLSIVVSAVQWGLVRFVVGNGTSVSIERLPAVFLVFIGSSLFFACVLLPYIYVCVKYMMEPDCRLSKLLFSAYKIGWRYWGFIFITLFLAMLCAVVCIFLISVPMSIITMASTLSAMGVGYMNDPSGLPSYFCILQYAVIAMSSFICLYINIFMIFVSYFMYGSIETREKERKEFLKIKYEATENIIFRP